MADPENQSDCDDSDNSDEDYVPEEKTGRVSEEENSGDAESDLEDLPDAPKSKRRRKSSPIKEPVAAVEETSKLDVDALWADFKKDTEDNDKRMAEGRKAAIASSSVAKPSSQVPVNPTASKNIGPVLPKSSTGGGGLTSILGKLGKKDKVSTLEKSRMDWNNFKKAEGIDEDLKRHNKGRDGFLDRRDFLERTDLRQFELEKQMRSFNRSSR